MYNEDLMLITVRHYYPSTIEQLIKGKKVLLEQRSRQTAQVVLKEIKSWSKQLVFDQRQCNPDFRSAEFNKINPGCTIFQINFSTFSNKVILDKYDFTGEITQLKRLNHSCTFPANLWKTSNRIRIESKLVNWKEIRNTYRADINDQSVGIITLRVRLNRYKLAGTLKKKKTAIDWAISSSSA